MGAEIEQLKCTLGQNAVMTDRSGQSIGREEGDGGDDEEDVIHRKFTLSGSSVDQTAAVRPLAPQSLPSHEVSP